jgi:hypothetical protein
MVGEMCVCDLVLRPKVGRTSAQVNETKLQVRDLNSPTVYVTDTKTILAQLAPVSMLYFFLIKVTFLEAV